MQIFKAIEGLDTEFIDNGSEIVTVFFHYVFFQLTQLGGTTINMGWGGGGRHEVFFFFFFYLRRGPHTRKG